MKNKKRSGIFSLMLNRLTGPRDLLWQALMEGVIKRSRLVYPIVFWVLLGPLTYSNLGAIINLGMITDIHIGDPDVGQRRCTQAIPKTEAAVGRFVASDVDAIVVLGDSMDTREDGPGLEELAGVVNRNSGFIPAYWCIGGHDCYHVDFNKTDWLTAVTTGSLTAQESTYFYVDIGNLRLIILDSCYKGLEETSSYPPTGPYEVIYVSSSQVLWLEDTLEDADSSNKFSVICLHHGLGVFGTHRDVQNSADVRTVLNSHKVIAVFNGHGHHNTHRISLGTNSDGNPIHHIGLESVADGDWVTENHNACIIASIDDTSGKLTGITGFYDAWGFKETAWQGTNDGDNWSLADNWTNGVPENGDTVLFDTTSTKNPGGSDQSATRLTELRVAHGYTGTIGNGSYLTVNADTLTLQGGFNDSRIYGDFNVCNASGGSGESKTVRFGASTNLGELNVNLTDVTWMLRFYHCGTVGRINLQNGLIEANMGTGYRDLVQTGGKFTLDNSAGEATSMLTADITDGIFDAGGSDNPMTIDKLIIRGGEIDLQSPDLTLTNGLEVYASPTSFLNYPNKFYDLVFEGQNSPQLTFAIDEENSVTIRANVGSEEPPSQCIGDVDEDGWLSPNDVSYLVAEILPHASSYYWKMCE